VAQEVEEAAEVAAEAAQEVVAEVAHQESECEVCCLRWQHHHIHEHDFYLLCNSG
jgi:hypothetical protein